LTTLAERPTSGLWSAILGSELLLVLSFARLWGDANSAAFRTNVLDATLDHPFWGTSLSRHVGVFVAALVLAHLALGVTAWTLAKLSPLAWPKSRNSPFVWTSFWLVVLVIWILAANAAWFPWSSLGNPYADAMSAAWRGVNLFHVVSVGVAVLLTATLARALHAQLRVARQSAKWIVGGCSGLAAAAAFASLGLPNAREPSTAHNRPHIIVIGFDSLRPDALRGPDGEDAAPAINAFLSQATIFPDTLTPLARTFPAWVSIVSGKHPHTTGAVMNLLTRDLIDEGDTLPRLLGDTGYRTTYATDEVRFSNLDETYGFEEVIAPPMGAADFLLGFFSDTPLANLLVNTWAGELLFPYAYANRAVAVTYDPDTFIERLDARLSFDRPTFLAIHFTLAHWPYTWASAPRGGVGINAPLLADQYRQSVARVDEQFAALIQVLDAKGALDDAIVVLLSDHGEALGEPLAIADDVHAKRHVRGVALPYGHGTTVFAESQYRVLFALRSFGTTPLSTRAGMRLDSPASLEDIAPTLAEALGISPERPFDGISWLPQFEGQSSDDHSSRIRYLETEFVPPGAASGAIVSASAIRGGATYYRVDAETDRLLIRPERLDEILANRQYAATRAGRLLAAVPSDDKRQQHVVYLEHPQGAPLWLRAAPSKPSDPGYDLWVALQARFDAVRDRPIAAPLGNVE
jgi:hypothetical protein